MRPGRFPLAHGPAKGRRGLHSSAAPTSARRGAPESRPFLVPAARPSILPRSPEPCKPRYSHSTATTFATPTYWHLRSVVSMTRGSACASPRLRRWSRCLPRARQRPCLPLRAGCTQAPSPARNHAACKRYDHLQLDPTQHHHIVSGGLDQVWARPLA
jgi:hypothetical protein